MHLKKVDGPRTVALPDGSILSHADLPDKSTVRWVASRKAVVVHAVKYGLLSKYEALDRYELSSDEFESWRKAIDSFGKDALKITAFKKYRKR